MGSLTTMLCEGQAIASKPIRRLDEGEVVKGFELPIKDSSTGLSRLHCHSLRDGTDGWVSVAGNKGTVFLEHFGAFHSCIRETIMTESLPMTSRPLKRID